ncbi:MAG TPA: histidine phosphatase family protein [Ramlibacter sp.]|nr:histidine phosphatase family protein [Ramlibacter sp.]
MKLWLARHARPLAADGVCYGASDLPADAQATAAAAAALARQLPAGITCRSSPLQRCRQLADALRQLRPDLMPQPDPRLAELDFGCWEGVRWDAIPQPAFDAWTADFAAHRFGGRESVIELLARVGQALAEARAGGGDTLWITHAGVVRATLVLLADAAPPRSANDWPREVLAFGALRCLPLSG